MQDLRKDADRVSTSRACAITGTYLPAVQLGEAHTLQTDKAVDSFDVAQSTVVPLSRNFPQMEYLPAY